MREITQIYEDPKTEKNAADGLKIPLDSKLLEADVAADVADQQIGVLDRRTEYKWLIASFFAMFLCGWSDASVGPLLLRIQDNYNVNYTVVSLLFITAFCGFFTAALINVPITDRFGIGWAFTIGSISPIIAYTIQSTAPPFALFLIAFFFSGVGVGLLDAEANTLIARLPDAEKQMSFLHAAYGAGALVSPLVATQFSELKHWNFHYLTSLGVAIINLVLVLYAFRLKSIETLFSDAGYIEATAEPEKEITVAATASPVEKVEEEGAVPSVPTGNRHIDPERSVTQTDVVQVTNQAGSAQKMGQIIRDPVVLLISFFAFVYVGLEITIGGWIVTFLRTVRGAGPSAGYVSSGFFGGLTLGRVLHVWVARRVPERYILFAYGFAAIALQIVVWTVKHVTGDGVAISLLGLVLGPFYPIIMNVLVAVLPIEITGGAIGCVAAVGQMGSAVFPFATGPLSEKYGVWALLPLLVAMAGALLVLWVLVLWICKDRWKVKRQL